MRTVDCFPEGHKAEAELGSRLDVRHFNYAIVQGGNMPVTLLDRVVDRYITSATLDAHRPFDTVK